MVMLSAGKAITLRAVDGFDFLHATA